MSELNETIQSADWKAEKHAPMIDAPDTVAAGQAFTVTAHLGAAIAHPNTPQHHIAWMSLYYLPEGAKQAIQLAKGGTLQALAYCNLHGLWQSSKPIRVEVP